MDATEYWAEVAAIAGAIVAESEDADADAVHEAVDGHAWVIYHNHAVDVLALVGPDEDDDYWLSIEGGWAMLVARAAYSALVRDVAAEVAALRAAAEDEDEDEDEDEGGGPCGQ